MGKKKKAATNPARGFATVSVASKPRPDKTETILLEGDGNGHPDRKGGFTAEPQTVDTPVAEPKSQQQHHNPTPQEFESQLEEDDLQLLVEKFGGKVKKDVQRQLSKMQMDCRVLRTQSQIVGTANWLNDDLVLEIIRQAKIDRQETPQDPRHTMAANSQTENEVVIQCWALQRALSGLQVSYEKALETVKAVLSLKPAAVNGNYIWGLEEALNMLAVEDDATGLFPFETRRLKGSETSGSRSDTDVDLSYVQTSSAVSYRETCAVDSRPSTPRENGGHEEADLNTLRDTESTESGSDVSEVDSDTEPDQLVAIYLSTKARLFHISPQLVDTKEDYKTNRMNDGFPTTKHQPPKVKVLQSKLKRIGSDILFDKDAADAQWVNQRNEILKQMAKTGLSQSSHKDWNISSADRCPPKEENNAEVAQPDIQKPHDADTLSESDDMLGEMFLAEHETTAVGPEPLVSSQVVTLKSFGSVSGLHPRRVLEDACRARDPGSRVGFAMVSPTTYSCRHSVTVNWVKGQETLQQDGPSSVMLEQRRSQSHSNLSSTMTFTTVTVATPDILQSEAYVATAALFWIFSTSASESKAYMKLPPAWRNLWSEFVEGAKVRLNAADRDELRVIRDLVHEQMRNDEDDGVVLSTGFGERARMAKEKQEHLKTLRPDVLNTAEATSFSKMWATKQISAPYQKMQRQRMTLPIFNFKETVLSAIAQHQVLILCGETGCGKSTQLPAYLLEQELSSGRNCRIYCTQPRRISAISLAQRVSEELGEHKGDLGTPRSLVGYAIRLETKSSASTKLIYVTVGIILRMLESSQDLNGVTHLIIDEVHERSIDTDFLLIVLRSLMLRRPELKVVLMSATVDATRFSNYLDGAPIMNVPGRTFPVQTMFLEDAIELTQHAGVKNARDTEFDDMDDQQIQSISKSSNQLGSYSAGTRAILADYDEYRIDYELIIKLIERILTDESFAAYSAAVLVFLPGIAEIRELHGMLGGHPDFSHNTVVYPLHSSIASEEQQAAFVVPRAGIRKIVLATNIAETGITIPDITCVIDTGKHKEMRYDERRHLSRLVQSFISRSNAKQRRGRAGRVQDGLCFHLFTKYRHDELMQEQQTPEMLRLSLQDLIMRVKICNLGAIESALAQALDPPASKNVRRAIDALVEIGALTPAQDLTILGKQIAKLPLDATLGKLCLLSAIFCCLDTGLTIAAVLSSKSPFVTPFGQRQAADIARLSYANSDSDLLTAYNAYCSWRRVSQDTNQNVFAYCRKNFLSQQNLTAIEDLKTQLLTSMRDARFVSPSSEEKSSSFTYRHGRTRFVKVPPELDRNSNNPFVTTSVISWSFYPRVLRSEGKSWRNITNSQSVTLHPTSVAKTAKSTNNIKFLSFYSLMQASSGAKSFNALSATPVQDFSLLIGPMGEADWKLYANICVIDGNRLRFKVDTCATAFVLKTLRKNLEAIVQARLMEPRDALNPRLAKWVGIWESISAQK